MFTKLKLALGLTGLLTAGTAGLALANGGGGGGFDKQKMLEKYDTNKDGVLDANEKAVMRTDFQAKRAAKKAERIAKFDKNGDGKLDATERAEMKATMSAERFAKLDTNKDGVISLQEFQAGRQGRHGGMHRHHGGAKHGGWKKGGQGGAGPGPTPDAE